MELAQFAAEMRLEPAEGIPATEAIYATGYWLLEKEQHADAAKVFRLLLHAAPRDERGWLGLGECHERIGQWRIALELYGTGRTLAAPSPRCELARARALWTLDREEEADAALDAAEELAIQRDDDVLVAWVRRARKEHRP